MRPAAAALTAASTTTSTCSGAWYEGVAISRDLMLYSAILLAGFAITKLPVEKLLAKKK